MNNLKIIKHNNGQLVTDSREVAEMVDVRHSDLLRTIGNYIMHLTNGEFRSLDFFIPSSYVDAKGETRPSILLTRKGCDMVANKMTGEKGVLFTATYVTRFEEMENSIKKVSQRSSFGDLASLMKEWRQWAKAMNMPPYVAMKQLIRFLQDKGEPIPNEMAYLPHWSTNQMDLFENG